MEMWHIYLFTRLDVLHKTLAFLTFLGIVSIISAIIVALCWDETGDICKDEKVKSSARMWVKISGAFLAVIIMAKTLIPTQNEAAAIYLIPKMVNSEFVKESQTIPTDVVKLMKLKLDAWAIEMNPVKK